MKIPTGFDLLLIFLIGFSSIFKIRVVSQTQTNPADAEAMLSLKDSLNPPESFGWSDPDPCKWSHVVCSDDNRVTLIQLGRQNLEGTLPPTLSKLSELRRVELQSNHLTGALPSLNGLSSLQVLLLNNNSFTGPVPVSLVNLGSLKVVNLTNNYLQGPMPKFNDSVAVDVTEDSNSFCLPKPGDCDPRVSTLISIVESMEYPVKFAESWKGNDPCAHWFGITCNGGNITTVNFRNMGLNGTISPEFASIKSLQRLILAENNLTGTIPEELTTLPALSEIDLENNLLYGKLPTFNSNLTVNTNGIPGIGNEKSNSSASGSSPNAENNGSTSKIAKKLRHWIKVLLYLVVGGVILIFLILLASFCWHKRNQISGSKLQPQISFTKLSSFGDKIMEMTSEDLRNATNNFNEENILGRGGFGRVYKGELRDGMKIAVKRMELTGIPESGLAQFDSEIAGLTRVRHRHIIALLGYCFEGDGRFLVYEYMPRGTLSSHLIKWAKEGLKPLEWTQRLTLALDVARGVEYLHSLAQDRFIHRDLKPSNILLGDDMRAKVADFGLARLAPVGKDYTNTRTRAGTYGYIAPEYAGTGQVSTKVDVYSFGVILMQLITGRKALDDSQPEENLELVKWFRRAHLNKDKFRKAKDPANSLIDPTIDLTEETLESISRVAELAGHCCANDPKKRPDMGDAVIVLSSLVKLWQPSDLSSDHSSEDV